MGISQPDNVFTVPSLLESGCGCAGTMVPGVFGTCADQGAGREPSALGPLPGFTDSEVNLNYSRLKDMSSAVLSGSQELLMLR